MCGIAGILALAPGGPAPELPALSRMVSALGHRGPDECGVYRDARVGLAHTRLSIVDLQTGQQPLCDPRGELWIIFNGEVFNHVELREELEGLGLAFRTRSDTEVIVQAFRAWGEDCFARFDGQFALALWDTREQELILARDRLGVRPLHLCEHEGRLLFASTAAALFAGDLAIPRRLDPRGLQQAFTFWAPLAPRTALEGVRELEPGTLRRYGRAGVRERRFWSPTFPRRGEERRLEPRAAAAEVLGALEKATSLRMLRSDVPVGSYLSGGLDSSLVATLGLRAKGARFSTFSVRFEDPEYDETRWQRLMASRLGSEHHERVVTRRDVAEVFPEVVRHAERPLLRTAPAPLFLLSRLVRESGVKVVLTGEGADEVFAGYDLFREARVRRFWARQPGSRLRPLLLERLYPWLARSPVAMRGPAREFFGLGLERAGEPGFSHEPRWRSATALQRLFSKDLRAQLAGHDAVAELLASVPDELRTWHPLAQDQWFELRTLLSSYLLSSQGDRMLMAHSVEGRFPFLDTAVIDLAAGLDPELKLRSLDEKHVLKRAAAGLVPEEILARKKQPYRAPDALAFAVEPPEWIAEVLSVERLRDAGVFDPAGVAQLWAKCRARAPAGQLSNADNMALVGVLSTQLLHDALVRRMPDQSEAQVPRVIDRLHPQEAP